MQKADSTNREISRGDLKRIALLCNTSIQNVYQIHMGERGKKNTPQQRKVKKMLKKVYELTAHKEIILKNISEEDAD